MHSDHCLTVIWLQQPDGRLVEAIPCEQALDLAGNLIRPDRYPTLRTHKLAPATAQILDYLRKQPTPATLTQIAAGTGVSKRSVLDRLRHLRRTGLVEFIPIGPRRALYTATQPKDTPPPSLTLGGL